MQTNKQVLRAMVESEEVSLQAMAEAREGFCCSKCDKEFIPQFGELLEPTFILTRQRF